MIARDELAAAAGDRAIVLLRGPSRFASVGTDARITVGGELVTKAMTSIIEQMYPMTGRSKTQARPPTE